MGESLSVTDFYHTSSFFWPAVSPSGRSLAFYREVDDQDTISLLDLETGTITPIRSDHSLTSTHRIVWDRTEESLYIHHCDTEAEQTDIYTLGLDGTTQPVVTRDGRCWLWDISPDNRSLLYSHRQPEADLWDSPRCLYRYDRDTDTHHQLTPADQFVLTQGINYSNDGEWISYAAATEANDSLLEASRVYITRADGTDTQVLDIGTDGSRTMGKDWHPTERRLLVSDTDPTYRCGVYDIPTDAMTWFGSKVIQEKPLAWLPGGDQFLAIRKAQTTTTPIVYDWQAKHARELAVSGSCSYIPTATDALIIDARRILVPRSTPTRPLELLAYDLQTDTTTRLLGTDDGIDPSRLVDPDTITYDSIDGCSIEALLYRANTQPSPAIVLVHGGRHGRASESYHWSSQFLVDRGVTVLRPNYRGSSGRGSAFKQAQYGDLGGYDAMDVAAGGQWLRRQDWINRENVAVYGHSYGGYLTYLQMVRYPNVWAAGIAAAGLTDLVAIYESNPDLPGLHEMGDPDDNPALLRQRSPLTHVEQFEGPLLMLHGDDDMVSPVSHARRFREALREHGFEEGEAFEYHEQSDQGHALIEQDQIRHHWETVATFLSRRLAL
jgi:dipeptidyl aminopeptidase/acylaminoacyl peptidase